MSLSDRLICLLEIHYKLELELEFFFIFGLIIIKRKAIEVSGKGNFSLIFFIILFLQIVQILSVEEAVDN